MLRLIAIVVTILVPVRQAMAQQTSPEHLPYQRATGIENTSGKRVWYLGTTDPGHDLIAEGRLSLREAIVEASSFFSLWVAAYAIALKGSSQQTTHMMQSWSNAMNICAGDPHCSITPMTDGSDGWEPLLVAGAGSAAGLNASLSQSTN